MCFATDLTARVAARFEHVRIAYAGNSSALKSSLPPKVSWSEQPTGDLGARLDSKFYEAFADGYSPIIALGIDSPSLPIKYVDDAISAMEQGSDSVLGPTDDGGYYLIGLRTYTPGLFAGIAWSTDSTYTDTARNMDACKLIRLELPPWYDVDVIEDLVRLKRDVRTNSTLQIELPHTSAWLSRHTLPDTISERLDIDV